jgi:hypothetical protein
MGRARQIRRVARVWAETLGAAAGIEAVDDFASGGPCGDEELGADDLLATLAPGNESWDTGAVNVGAAEIDRCPAGYESSYYEAYEAAAVARVRALAAERGGA